MGTVEGVGTHKFGEEVAGVVVEEGDMVGIPMHRARHMKHQFGNKQQQRRHCVRDILGLLVVTGVEGVHHVVL